VHVVAPASSANLGPGFDTLGLALDLPFEVIAAPAAPAGYVVAEPTHPAAEAFQAAGGTGPLWWRSPIPPGRGLGFSGAAAVAGAFAAGVGVDETFEIAARLEGHPDNAAPSAYGGVCVAAGGEVVRLDPPPEVEVVVWWPDTTTSTRRARSVLPTMTSFDDAVFNVGRSSLLVAALATGRLDVLRVATEDRLHQDVRLARAPRGREVLANLLDAGALGAWVSGSGPTIAALMRVGEGDHVLASLSGGRARVLRIAATGVCEITEPDQNSRI